MKKKNFQPIGIGIACIIAGFAIWNPTKPKPESQNPDFITDQTMYGQNVTKYKKGGDNE